MIRLIFRFIFVLIAIAAILISIQYLFNGGIDTYGSDIKDLGFWGFVKEFFSSIWTGFKDTVGIR